MTKRVFISLPAAGPLSNTGKVIIGLKDMINSSSDQEYFDPEFDTIVCEADQAHDILNFIRVIYRVGRVDKAIDIQQAISGESYFPKKLK